VHFRGETDDLWGDIVDKTGSLNSQAVHKREKLLRLGRIAFHIRIVLAPAFDECEGLGLHQVVGHDVGMDVDHWRPVFSSRIPERRSRSVATSFATLSRRSDVSAE